MRLQPIAKDARDGVIRAAGQEADHEFDRAGGKFIGGEGRQRTADQAKQHQQRNSDHDQVDGHGFGCHRDTEIGDSEVAAAEHTKDR